MAERFLLVGNGAREHAIAEAICKSKDVSLFCYANARNPGIDAFCIQTGGESKFADITNGHEIAKWAQEKKITLAFPSPDAVLHAGVVDALEAAGIPCCAPCKAAARLEWDKSYLRNLMVKYKIEGCPKYSHFNSHERVRQYIDELGDVAIKPVGLTGGKGVAVMGFQLKDLEEAKEYAFEILSSNMGGGLGVVVEEKLVGEEFTLMAFSDGKKLLAMPAVQDHKRAYEDDLGPNTGGMGSYTSSGMLLPFLTHKDYNDALSIMQKIIDALHAESGVRFKGVLYGQFMATKDGIGVIETNARFGDPEAMNVLPLLNTPLLEVFKKISKGDFGSMQLDWSSKATVVKYLVPHGYPAQSAPPSELKVDYRSLEMAGAKIYYASVDEQEKRIMTQKSRSIAVLGMGNSISWAEEVCESGCQAISGNVWHRKDIGTDALVQKRVEHMRALRGRKN